MRPAIRPAHPVLPIVLALALLLAFAPAATAQSARWLPAAAADLATSELAPAAKRAMAVPVVERTPVAFSWPLAADAAVELAPEPFVASSREHWLEVTAAELAAGVPLLTSAPGAVVRVNPVATADKAVADRLALDPAALVLRDAAGRERAPGAGMATLADAKAMAATGVPFAPGTTAFRVGAELGAGRLELRAPGLVPSAERYVVHVLDAGSAATLEVTTDRVDYLAGDRLTVRVGLAAGVLGGADGYVTAPDGRALPLRFVADADGGLRARIRLPRDFAAAPGLWEVHVAARGTAGGFDLLRHGRTAFGAAVPTARLDRAVAWTGGATAELGVAVAAAGRYEVRGVLYGTAADGALRPVAAAAVADWLEPGSGRLALAFDMAAVAAAGVGAPFEVRDLRLLDQGRLATLHRQGRALRIE